MKQLSFAFNHSLAPHDYVHTAAHGLSVVLEEMQAAVKKSSYETPYASIVLPSDTAFVKQAEHLAHACKDAEAIVVIGIGGSNLGTIAVHEALHGKLHNAMGSPRVFFADTVDTDSMRAIGDLVAAYAKAKKRVILNVISKSGSTTETIANFEVLYSILKQYTEHAERDVVATTDKGSALWELGKRNEFALLEIPKDVGGRYSVLSTVGLFPLAMLGVDVHAMLQGAKDARERCLAENVNDNPALHSAAVRAYHFSQGRAIQDLFLFASDLESVGKWWRQLLAESNGKETSDGSAVGITPTVSIGSTDLHSVGQLYLGGPRDKLTTFVHYKKTDDVHVPNMPEYDAIVSNIQGRTLHSIMDAIREGTAAAFVKQERPFIEITIPERSAYCIGQLLQTLMIETILVCKLFGVNPFDQPHVEHYKKETRAILKHE